MSSRCIAVMTVAWAGLACAQTSFEVASVKPAQTQGTRCDGGPGTRDPALWTCRSISLAYMISLAYDLQRYQYKPPDWMLDSRYDIVAKIPPGTTKEQFRQMQQDLLIKRFHLRFHFQPEEMPVSEITLAKPGLLKESAAAAAEQRDFVPGPISSLDGSEHWNVTNVSMNDITPIFALQLGGPVQDATGLKGRYDLSLHWYREITPELKTRLEALGETVTTGEGGPTFKQALQNQLGLKLEVKKGTVPVMHIDHADKVPSAN
jgi:uncharacterized protein (TIGR03435 family)